MKSPDFGEPRYALRDDGVIKKCMSPDDVEAFALGHSVTLTAKDPLCDFCSRGGEPEYREYPCRKFTVLAGGRQHNSIGAWLACGSCAELIEAGDRDALVDRAAVLIKKQVGTLHLPARIERDYITQSRNLVRTLHDAFFRYRIDGESGEA